MKFGWYGGFRYVFVVRWQWIALQTERADPYPSTNIDISAIVSLVPESGCMRLTQKDSVQPDMAACM
jgi:hypothetical protein